MLIIENLSLNNFVIIIRAELAPGVVLHLIVESFANHDDVGVLANWA